jgi:LysM repeat protein
VTDRWLLQAEWPEGPVTVLAAWRATPGERAAALPVPRAIRVIDGAVLAARLEERHHLVGLAELLDDGEDFARPRAARESAERLREAVRSGRLLVVAGWGALGGQTTPPASDQARALGSLIARIMAGQPSLMLQGARYVLLESGGLREAQQAAAPDELHVVPRAEAAALLGKLAGTLTGERSRALAEAGGHLAPTEPRALDGLVLVRRVPTGWHTAPVQAPTVTPSQLRPAPAPAPTRQWIRVRVLEAETDRPIPDLVLVLTSAEGAESRLTTSAQGVVALEGIDPSTYTVSSPLDDGDTTKTSWQFVGLSTQPAEASARQPAPQPLRQPDIKAIAVVERHNVADGDTLESIAAAHGLAPARLAKFNWGADDPDTVARALRDEVGCSKQTPDGKSYLLQASDKPGIVLVPRPWKVEGLVCQQTHVVHVKTGARFFVSLENDLGLRIPEAAYEATLADGVVVSGSLGIGGLDAIEAPPPGPVIVTYPDQYDIAAKSLAARVRQSFRDRDPQELYRILGHPPDTVADVVAAYDRYFDDHTGQGFVEDVYAEITDPDALTVVEVLLARAGLPTRAPLLVTSLEHHQTEAD